MKDNKQLTLLAKRIRQARLHAHLSQAELGKGIGVSDKSISSYEGANSVPSLETLRKIAEQTKLPLTFFTEEETSKADIAARLSSIEKDLAELKKLLNKQS